MCEYFVIYFWAVSLNGWIEMVFGVWILKRPGLMRNLIRLFNGVYLLKSKQLKNECYLLIFLVKVYSNRVGFAIK